MPPTDEPPPAILDALWERHAEAKLSARTPDDLSLSRLSAWLEARGEVVGRAVLLAFRERLIEAAMSRSIAAGNSQFVHVRVHPVRS